MGLPNPLASSVSALTGLASSYAWPTLLSVSRSAILSLLKNIQVGSLQIVDTDGTVVICGTRDAQAKRLTMRTTT